MLLSNPHWAFNLAQSITNVPSVVILIGEPLFTFTNPAIVEEANGN